MPRPPTWSTTVSLQIPVSLIVSSTPESEHARACLPLQHLISETRGGNDSGSVPPVPELIWHDVERGKYRGMQTRICRTRDLLARRCRTSLVAMSSSAAPAQSSAPGVPPILRIPPVLLEAGHSLSWAADSCNCWARDGMHHATRIPSDHDRPEPQAIYPMTQVA